MNDIREQQVKTPKHVCMYFTNSSLDKPADSMSTYLHFISLELGPYRTDSPHNALDGVWFSPIQQSLWIPKKSIEWLQV